MSGFGDIIGHRRTIGVLRNAMRQGKVAHAYLFAGPPGIGKYTVARTFAAALNCQTLPDDACGVCPSCRKFAAGNHPDFVAGTRRDDKTVIVIEQIREVIHSAQYAPFEGKFKVYLIDGAEQLNTEAANALLKTLVEPNARTVFVLVTPASHLLLPTVVSRCQTLRFGLLEDSQIRAWLDQQGEWPPEDAALLARLAEGSIGRATALDLDFIRGPRLSLFQDLAAAAPDDAAAAVLLGDRLSAAAPDLRDGLELLAGFVRDALIWRISGDAERVRNRDALEAIQRYAARLPLAALGAKIRSLVQARRLIERNVNKSAIVGGLCLDLIATAPTSFAEGRLPR